MRSDPTLKKWYRFINHKFFHGELPNDVCVRWSNDEDDEDGFENKYFGIADHAKDSHHTYEIVMSRSKNEPASSRMLTLVHEMIHIATSLKDNHGPVFEAWWGVLYDRGILKKGAIRKGITLT
jgi:hypothetical protein